MDNLKLAALNCLVSGLTENRFVFREVFPGGAVYLDCTDARKALARGQGTPVGPARPSHPPRTHLLPPLAFPPLPSGGAADPFGDLPFFTRLRYDVPLDFWSENSGSKGPEAKSPGQNAGDVQSKSTAQVAAFEKAYSFSARVVGIDRDAGREFVIVHLYEGDFLVAEMEVDNFPALVDAAIVTKLYTELGDRWTMGLRDGDRIPLFRGRTVSEMFTTRMTRKEALSLSGCRKWWVVDRVAGNQNVLQEVEPFAAKKGRLCLLVSKAIVVPSREPLVECVVCQHGGPDVIPTIAGGLTDLTHGRVPFHGLVSLALNGRVWADVEMRPDGRREIARIVPNFGKNEVDQDRSLWGVYTRTRVGCVGLDVQLANGQKVDLLKFPLHEHPWPKRPRKSSK